MRAEVISILIFYWSMRHHFKLQDFPFANFEIETSIWTLRSKLSMNNAELEKSEEKGGAYLIPRGDGSLALAFKKQIYPDFVPALEIDGKLNPIFDKLKWHEYFVGVIPILLIFIGGALGGLIGLVATRKNFNVFRQDGNVTLKYLEVIGITVFASFLYIILPMLIAPLFN